MSAQILFTAALLGSWLYIHAQTRLLGLVKLILYAVVGAGLFFVWLPDDSTRLANLLGIGRGADLIYYTWIILSLAVFINVHLKLKQTLTLVTQLARHIAIVEAERDVLASRSGASAAAPAAIAASPASSDPLSS
jgi:hypothetical protein